MKNETHPNKKQMDIETFDKLQDIRQQIWDASYSLVFNRDILDFLDDETRAALILSLQHASRDITNHIHAENGWGQKVKV